MNLLSKAYELERSRDIDGLDEILSSTFGDFPNELEMGSFSPSDKAEIYRLYGKLFISKSKAKALPEIIGYQERGENLLNKALSLFEEIGDEEKAALVKCQLALSYYYSGRISEADAVLFQAEGLFRLKQTNPYYLEIKINHLIALIHLRRESECHKIIERHESSIRLSANHYLQIMFFNQCGMFFNNIEQHEKAEKYFYNAYRAAQKSGNLLSVGQVSNNIAYTCRKTGELYKAYDYARRAISVAKEMKDAGWLANYLDTKASIELDLGDPARALETIEISIDILSETGDNISLVESLWTKVEVLFALDKVEKAIPVFKKLAKKAASGIGESEAEFYAKRFEEKLNFHNKLSERFDLKKASDGDGIIRFYPFDGLVIQNLSIENNRLFYVPAPKAGVLGFDRDVIVCAFARKKPNPIVMVRGGEEYLVGDLIRDEGMDLTILYTGKNQTDPVCVSPYEAQIEGSIDAIALADTLAENYLYFENFESEF